MKEIIFDQINIGDKASFEREITENDLNKFADVSGDYNPLHIDTDYAKKTKFNGKIVHGMFLGALVSRLVGMELPGKYALLVKESLEFKSPGGVGDTVIVNGYVMSKSKASRMIEIAVEIRRGAELLVKGSVHVILLQ
jgi:acyl dehydratase